MKNFQIRSSFFCLTFFCSFAAYFFTSTTGVCSTDRIRMIGHGR